MLIGNDSIIQGTSSMLIGTSFILVGKCFVAKEELRADRKLLQVWANVGFPEACSPRECTLQSYRPAYEGTSLISSTRILADRCHLSLKALSSSWLTTVVLYTVAYYRRSVWPIQYLHGKVIYPGQHRPPQPH